ncbi:hypothetical protein [Rikenella microfusus]|uniref:hypothetical protein n=1 Tax=Rikenella microfusus TaxID=28139 RepID=UPI0011C01CDF|nr:hypothetical protein [Rikenella microfusus]
METSNSRRRYVVSRNGQHFEVSEPVVDLIVSLQECISIEDAVERFSKKRGRSYTSEEFVILMQTCISPLFVPKAKGSKRTKAFLFRKDLLSENVISHCSEPLKGLFHFGVILPVLLLVAVLEVMFFTGTTMDFFIDDMTAPILMGLVVLFLFSSMFHELGHAAACKFFRVDHGPIGFAIYLIFPVFYTDISNVWTLSRKKRTVINFAGVYFQLIFLIPLLVIYLLTDSELLKYCIVIINFNFIFTLNPFFKFDGYWVMSDLLGVPNLRGRSRELFAYLFSSPGKRRQMKRPFLLTMRQTEKIFFVIYSVIVNLFFIYYFVYVIPHFIGSFIDTFPAKAREVILSLSFGKMPDFGTLRAVFVQLLFMGLCAYLIFNLGLALVKSFKRKKTTCESSQDN